MNIPSVYRQARARGYSPRAALAAMRHHETKLAEYRANVRTITGGAA